MPRPSGRGSAPWRLTGRGGPYFAGSTRDHHARVTPPARPGV
ncbi:hypothetical protein SLI_1346 [Streptomyces lividans 1326]|uniref:Uncharacterized protein n=1 Tax=Streptomyces lividans 1326 TaxID=1200984 RepID=A0A7U9H962_STRLI|nr:hypothetical protein SLI_1346 [Streptomyces lividans 1326]